MKSTLSLLLLGLFALVPARSSAQQTFTKNDYTVDLVTTPLLGAGRIVGMAGAYSAIATGIDGVPYNPAGYGERYEKEIDWLAFDVTGGLSLSGVFARNDFDNDGKVTQSKNSQTYQVMLGLRLQFSYFGTGLSWLRRRYQLRGSEGRDFEVTLDTYRTGAGYSFLNGGLVAGFTVSIFRLAISGGSGEYPSLSMPLNPFISGRDPIRFTGYGGEVGVLLRPAGERYRIGLVGRTEVSATLDDRDRTVGLDGVRRAQGLVLPEEVHIPWEITWGFAYQFGERRTNTPWRNTRELRRQLREQLANGSYAMPPTYGEEPYQPLPQDPRKTLDVAMAIDREAERRFRRHQPRRYVLLSADMILYGKTAGGHGIDAFLTQTPQRSGEKVSFGMRVGVESEVWPYRAKVRAGTYLEPSRFEGRYYRPHGTAGFDVRLFDIWRWSVRGTGTVDLAPRYFNWGIAFGLWW